MGINAQYIGKSAAMIKGHSLGAALGAALAVSLAAAAPARADGFDYYVLALSWSPSWCQSQAAQGDAPEQCAPDRDLGFSLHGLWPQYADGGWPEYCRTFERDPAKGRTAAMADIMGSGGLAWYQWKKHGRCSDLSAEAYFDLSRRAYEAISLPEFPAGRRSAAEVEEALLAANPAFRPDDMVVTCSDGQVREARICLTPELEPRACGPDVLRDACRSNAPLDMPPAP